MDREKLLQLIKKNSFVDVFIDDRLEYVENYTSEEYPEFLADKIISAYNKHELD